LGGTEWKRRLLPAARADGNSFLFIKLIWRSLGWGSFLLADLAPFGQVSKLLVVEENLLPGSEHKILAAVYTLQYFVLEFHGIPFQPQVHPLPHESSEITTSESQPCPRVQGGTAECGTIAEKHTDEPF
jgi:hypothetical protein